MECSNVTEIMNTATSVNCASTFNDNVQTWMICVQEIQTLFGFDAYFAEAAHYAAPPAAVGETGKTIGAAAEREM